MEREEEKSRGFKVEDRRRFSAEGEVKPEFRDADARAAAAASARPAEAAPAGAGESVESPLRAAPHLAGAAAAHGPAAGPEPEVTFGAFLVGLSTQALMHLGDIADPETGQASPDLNAAQQIIDIIGMLQRKTHGNLDREEAQLIEAILFELRMKYVEQARTLSR